MTRSKWQNVLEICPYEPPASGWTTRVKLVRRLIRERGGVCEVLDIGPSREVAGRDCICVGSGPDFLRKVVGFARRGFVVHCHVNGEYFRGLLLAIAAAGAATLWRTRCVVTFHAGTDQPFLHGVGVGPVFRLLFLLADAVVCNSDAVRSVLTRYVDPAKITAIPAFSRQYLEYREVPLNPEIRSFMDGRAPIVSTYLCFREGFFVEVALTAIASVAERIPGFGVVVVGTGGDEPSFRRTAARLGVEANIHLAGDLDHDAFMTVLKRSQVHLRTPVTDGVSATVLEALSLGVPVVASENGTRPASVRTYAAADAAALARTLLAVLEDLDGAAAAVCRPEIEDTAEAEVELLLGNP